MYFIKSKINNYLFAALFMVLSPMVYPQNLNSPYEIGTWQGFKDAAVCFTFDDGCPNQFKIALPMFNEYGFKMTLFTVTNWKPQWNILEKAAEEGHEIASHTIDHPNFDTLNDAQQTAELAKSQEEINAHVTAQKCVTIAYPYCVAGNKPLCNKYYIAARGCSGAIEPSTPKDFMNISSFVCGTLGQIKTPKDFGNLADSAASVKGLVVFLIHGIDNDGGYSPVTTANLRGALDYMKENNSRFWVSTFGNAARYIKERDNAKIKELSVKENEINFSVSDTLDNAIYNYPVTVRRQLPAGWASGIITQNGKTINSEIVETGSVKSIMFDVAPNSGEIILSKKTL